MLSKVQNALEILLRDNPGVRPEKLVSAHIEGKNDEGVRGSQAFVDLAMPPPILVLVEQMNVPKLCLLKTSDHSAE